MTDWMNGSLVQKYLEENDIQDGEFADFLTRKQWLMPSLILYGQPLQRLQESFDTYSAVMNVETLTRITGWSTEAVTRAFTPTTLFYIIVAAQTKTLESKIKNIAYQIETTMSSEQLATALNMDQAHIEKLLPLSVRVSLCTIRRDPVAAAKREVDRLTAPLLQPAAIAQAVGWSAGEVKVVFTDSMLRQFAGRPVEQQLAEVQRIAQNYRLLSPDNLAERLHMKQGAVRMFFPKSVRAKIACLRTDHMAEAARVVRLGYELADSGLPLHLAISMAANRYTAKRAQELAKFVLEESKRCPPGTSKSIWMWIVAHAPNAGRDRHEEILKNYHEGLAGMDASSVPLDGNPFGSDYDGTLYDKTTNKTTDARDPQDIIASAESDNDARNILKVFAEQAGLSDEQLDELLDQFAHGGIDSDDTTSAILLEQLRKAALTPSA